MKRAGSVACLSAASAIVVWTVFTNIDMTQARLLVEFWPRWLAVLALAIAAIGLAEERC